MFRRGHLANENRARCSLCGQPTRCLAGRHVCPKKSRATAFGCKSLRSSHFATVLDRSGMGKRLEHEREAKRAAEELTRIEEARKREAQENARRVKEAKKAAGINVKSSPGQTANVRTLDDDLKEIARRHYG